MPVWKTSSFDSHGSNSNHELPEWVITPRIPGLPGTSGPGGKPKGIRAIPDFGTPKSGIRGKLTVGWARPERQGIAKLGHSTFGRYRGILPVSTALSMAVERIARDRAVRLLGEVLSEESGGAVVG
jgi:hypothetical protein